MGPLKPPYNICESGLVSLLIVTDSRANLTPDKEDARYGSLEDHLNLSRRLLAKARNVSIDEVISNPGMDPKDDFVWDGWQATYLSLKKGGVDDYGNKQTDVKRRNICADLSEVEVMCAIYRFLLDKAYVLAAEGCMVMQNCEYWTDLEELVGKIECDALKEKFFDCTVKFCLSIWAEEDIERMLRNEQIVEEYRKFWMEVCMEDIERMLRSEQIVEEYRKFWMEEDELNKFAIGEMKLPYKCLIQSDFYHAYMRFQGLLEYEPVALVYIPEELKSSGMIDKFKPRALQLLREHRPLKEEYRAQVLLELSLVKCFHVTDILILEAIHGLKLPEFGRKNSAGLDPENAEKLNKLLQNLTEAVYDLIHMVSMSKAERVRLDDGWCMYPMTHLLGVFKDEVIDVIRIACYERRLRNQPFITMSHILTGLSCSRVADCLDQLQLPPEKSCSEFLLLELYVLSDGLRRLLGEDAAGLEHFVFTFAYGSLKIDDQRDKPFCWNLVERATNVPGSDIFQKLKYCRAESRVKSWRNLDVFTTILEKRYRSREVVIYELLKTDLMVKLDNDLKSGNVIMPCGDDFRVPQ